MKVFSHHCEQIGFPLPPAPTNLDKKPTVEQAIVPLHACGDSSMTHLFLLLPSFSLSLWLSMLRTMSLSGLACVSLAWDPLAFLNMFSVFFIKFGRLQFGGVQRPASSAPKPLPRVSQRRPLKSEAQKDFYNSFTYNLRVMHFISFICSSVLALILSLEHLSYNPCQFLVPSSNSFQFSFVLHSYIHL